MTSTLIKYNVILIVLCIGITLIHNSSEATVKEHVILYYNHLIPQCRSVLLTLGALELKITLKPIDLLNGEQIPENLRKINSSQTVPVLLDGDLVITESDAIIMYLVQQYGKTDDPLYPHDPKSQSLIIQQLMFNNTYFYSAFEILPDMGILRGKQITTEVYNKIHKSLNSLEKTLEKSDWAVGKIMTVADFALVASISTFKVVGFDLRRYEKIKKWLSNLEKTTMAYYDKANQEGINGIKSLLESSVKKDVTLYYNHLSPQCRSVLLTLKALDLEITLIPIDLLNGEQIPENLRTINSLQTVPVLKDKKFFFFESDEINVHLVENYGDEKNLLYPSICGKFLSKIIQTLIFNKINFYSALEILSNPGISRGIQKITKVDDKIRKALNSLDVILEKSVWAAGESMTLADFALVASISTFEVFGFGLSGYKSIQFWLSMCKTTMAYYDTANKVGIDGIKSLLKSKNGFQNKTKVIKDVILYYNHVSPQCKSVLLTLKALDLEITLIPIDLLNGEKLPAKFREKNSLQTVPVLQDGDLVFFESHLIMVYLVQQYGGSDHSLYPNDPKIQAQANQILHFVNSTLYPAFKNKYNPGILSKDLTSKNVEDKIHEILNFIEQILKKSKWAVGDTMTLADVGLFASISTLEVFGFDLREYQHIQNWLSKCKTTTMTYYDKANIQGIIKILFSLLKSQEMKNSENKIINDNYSQYFDIILP